MICYITIVVLVILSHPVQGLTSCEDFEPCTDIEDIDVVKCDQPGIAYHCMKTCDACHVPDNGAPAECSTGFIEVENRCSPCSELASLLDVLTRNECPQDCDPGTWGRRCDKPCPPGCRSMCEKWSGRCLGGCIVGTYGSHCGLHCENCGGRGTCNRDGECTHGCKTRWTGDMCLQHH